MWRLTAAVLLLVAVAVVCVPKVGNEATPEAEVTLCAASLHGSACECADRSHDVLGHDTDVEHVAAYRFYLSETNPTATTREIRRPARCIGLDERAILSCHLKQKGARSVGVRAGRPSGA
jgi:hypothetical protein